MDRDGAGEAVGRITRERSAPTALASPRECSPPSPVHAVYGSIACKPALTLFTGAAKAFPSLQQPRPRPRHRRHSNARRPQPSAARPCPRQQSPIAAPQEGKTKQEPSALQFFLGTRVWGFASGRRIGAPLSLQSIKFIRYLPSSAKNH